MYHIYFLIPIIPIVLVIILLIVCHFRKKHIIKKVCCLCPKEKKQILDALGEPGGYSYDPYQDIFTSTLDAPQKIFGYTTFYNLAAPYFNMVFDYETIYFNYDNRTWLIEMWKGQYGINTGCELGIYYADTIIPPEQYHTTHFQAVEPQDMLDISLKLHRYSIKNRHLYPILAHRQQHHWWLTIFKMGEYINPKELLVNTSIHFKDYEMMHRFINSFEKTLPFHQYKVIGLTVYFTFYQSMQEYNFFKRMVRRIALCSCFLYCKWFSYITRPFEKSGDKLLYLYYYLPFTIRHLFKKITRKKIL